MRVADFLTADLSCFGARDVKVAGWADVPPIFGVLPPAIQPQWLWFGVTSVVIWDRPRGSLSDLACSQGQCPPYLFLNIAPGSSVSVDRVTGWVVVTGHRDDPVADTCHYVYPPGWTEAPFPDQEARDLCRTAFVLISIKASNEPAST